MRGEGGLLVRGRRHGDGEVVREEMRIVRMMRECDLRRDTTHRSGEVV